MDGLMVRATRAAFRKYHAGRSDYRKLGTAGSVSSRTLVVELRVGRRHAPEQDPRHRRGPSCFVW